MVIAFQFLRMHLNSWFLQSQSRFKEPARVGYMQHEGEPNDELDLISACMFINCKQDWTDLCTAFFVVEVQLAIVHLWWLHA